MIYLHFREHMTKEHNLNVSVHDKLYRCPFCSEIFDRRSTMLKHRTEKHPNESQHICSVCGKKCNTPSELTKHNRIHTGIYSMFSLGPSLRDTLWKYHALNLIQYFYKINIDKRGAWHLQTVLREGHFSL